MNMAKDMILKEVGVMQSETTLCPNIYEPGKVLQDLYILERGKRVLTKVNTDSSLVGRVQQGGSYTLQGRHIGTYWRWVSYSELAVSTVDQINKLYHILTNTLL